ncbi:MAG: hypothetical protein RIQ47_398 [Bacteroidota bacterium]|jgi:putative hydrolase of the HAD superfamily
MDSLWTDWPCGVNSDFLIDSYWDIFHYPTGAQQKENTALYVYFDSLLVATLDNDFSANAYSTRGGAPEMNGIRHVFFDLDNTIWDFEKSSMATLRELYDKYTLAELGVTSFDSFVAAYKHRNELLWEEYRMGKVDKATLRNKRFALTFWDMGLDPETAPAAMADDYVELGPRKSHLFPHAHETLDYLRQKYTLHIITNGFAEAQSVKMEASDLNKYFNEVIISEHTGYKKPDVRIFQHSMEKAGAMENECLMIGDGLEVDVIGAQQAGWRAIFFNPHGILHEAQPDVEIKELKELMGIL